jgi:hypothetical protein
MRILLFCLFTLFSFVGYSQTVNVTGRCFYDVNGNNYFDGPDSAIANRVILALGQSSSNSAITLPNGDFSFPFLSTGFYSFNLTGNFDNINYKGTNIIQRNYPFGGGDYINFIFKKKDSIESMQTSITPTITGGISPTAGVRTYTLKYAYDGLLPSIPATLSLRFNPKLNLQSASLPPSVTSSGLLQWNLSNLNRNSNFTRPYDSIVINLNYPTVGDTITWFILSQKLVSGISFRSIFWSNASNYKEKINHLLPTPIGTSSGVKWLRHYAPSGLSDTQNGNSVDTTQDGNGYFVAGKKSRFIQSIGRNSKFIYVSKLNKDGLSIWEKNIKILQGSFVAESVSAIKHTSDGGCLVLGAGEDTSTNTNYYYNRIFVLRFNQAGDLLWQKRLLTTRVAEPGKDIVTFPDGSFMITGWAYSNDGDFIHNNADVTNKNVFVTKFSSNGNVVFTKVYGGSSSDEANRLIPLQNGTLLILGSTFSNDGDVMGAHQHYIVNQDSAQVFSKEAWVININANGDMIWNKCYGGKKHSEITGAIDNNGGILLTGQTNSKDGDLPYYPESKVSLWVQQISTTNGSIEWNKLYKLYNGYQDSNYINYSEIIYDFTTEYPNNYPSTRIHKSVDGNFIIGNISSDKYGSVKTKHGNADFIFVKIDQSGNILWQKAIGGTKEDNVNDFIIDKNDDIVFTGSSFSNNDDLYQQPERGANMVEPSLMVVGKLGITNIIKGQVFIDNNNNHIKDPGEIFYSLGQVKTVKGTDTIVARIFNGKFLNNLDTGNYVSTYTAANNYYTIYPASKNTSFTTFDMMDSVDFALTPIPGINDLEIQVLPMSTPRPGFPVTYRIITKNVGTTTLNNVVVGFKKDTRQLYNSASRPSNGIVADSIWWGPFTLNAFGIDTLYANFTLKAPPLLNNGDTITNTVTANPITGDYTMANNRAVIREIVRGSFDPNDKKESHGGTLTTTQYAGGEYLEYLIRFQNTGTDTAFFVTVKDTLQQKLDLNTLEIVSASHPFTFNLEGQVATWDFKKILLPDSASSQAGSNGFILFRVKPKTGLVVGDIFSNKAAIYFDFNLPVITNEDKTLLGNKNTTCPNGSISFESGLTGTTYQWQMNDGTGYIDLTNGGIYSGVTSSVLRLANVPTSLRGNKYRCLVNGINYSPENILRFSVTWKGTLSTAWGNPSNWDCGVLPDSKTDVVIPVSVRYPLVGIAASCYSLQLAPSSSVTVTTGFNLLIAGVSGF